MLFEQHEQRFFCTVLIELSFSRSLAHSLKCHSTNAICHFTERSSKGYFFAAEVATKMLIKWHIKEWSTFADDGISRLSEIMSSGWTGMYKQCQVCQKDTDNDVSPCWSAQKTHFSPWLAALR